MTSWELAAKAIQTGIKIKKNSWVKNYIYFSSTCWIGSDNKIVYPEFGYGDWEEYVEPKEPEYLYEFMFKNMKGGYSIYTSLRTKFEIQTGALDVVKLLRKFDPDTLEEIIEDQNAKD